MSSSIGSGKFHPGQDLPVTQLLHAARRKQQGTTHGGRCVWTIVATRKVTQIRVLQDHDDFEPE